jgi:hypothetical protein
MCAVNRLLCVYMNKHLHAVQNSDFSKINNSKRNLHEFHFIASEAEYKTFNLRDMIRDVVSLNTHRIVFTRGENHVLTVLQTFVTFTKIKINKMLGLQE